MNKMICLYTLMFVLMDVQAQTDFGFNYGSDVAIVERPFFVEKENDAFHFFYGENIALISFFGEHIQSQKVEVLYTGTLRSRVIFFEDVIADEILVFHAPPFTAPNPKEVMVRRYDRMTYEQIGDDFILPITLDNPIQRRENLAVFKQPNSNYWVFGLGKAVELAYSVSNGFSIIKEIPLTWDQGIFAQSNSRAMVVQNNTDLVCLNANLDLVWSKSFAELGVSEINKLKYINGAFYILGKSISGNANLIKLSEQGEMLFDFESTQNIGAVQCLAKTATGLILTVGATFIELDNDGMEVGTGYIGENVSDMAASFSNGLFVVGNSFFEHRTFPESSTIRKNYNINYLENGRLTIPINSNGKLFDGDFAQIIPASSFIFSSSFWSGGFDDMGNLRIATPYTLGQSSYQFGNHNYTHPIFDHVWKIRRQDLVLIKNDLVDGIKDEAWPYDIVAYPAKGNPNFIYKGELFEINDDLAPFIDANGDGIYNIFHGDEPDFEGLEMLISFYNLNNTFSTWSFDAMLQVFNRGLDESLVLKNTMTNTNDFGIPLLRMGHWADADLGCYFDDYIGSMPDKNTAYVYNADELDGDLNGGCAGVPTLGLNPPILTFSILGDTLDSFIAYNNPFIGNPNPGSSDPAQPIEYYRFLSGYWRDGTPISVGGNGYDPSNTDTTRYIFHSNPSDPQGWSMCTANLPLADERLLMNQAPKAFSKNEKASMELAISLIESPNLPCPDVSLIESRLDSILNNIGTSNAPNWTIESPAFVHIFPNPSSQRVFVEVANSTIIEQIELFNLQGQMVQQHYMQGNNQFSVAHLQAGLYFLKLKTTKGQVVQRLIVQH